MNLPIDIPALLRTATDIDKATQTSLSVSIYIDDTASGELIGHVRSAFASAGATTRVTLNYLEDELLNAAKSLDMAVIVAGRNKLVGAQAAHLRSEGVPTMVVAEVEAEVAAIASDANTPIPDGDLVAIDGLPNSVARDVRDVLLGQPVEQEFESELTGQGLPFDKETVANLDIRMGEWIIAACSDKKLAFAFSFPFVRRPLSLDAVNNTSLQNAAIGVAMIIPGADMPIMTLNQAKMILQIAAAYNQPMNAQRVKELAGVVGGAYLCRNIARSAASVVPLLGWAVKGVVGYTGTALMGRATIEYFEGGGDITGVANVLQKARDEAVEASKKIASTETGAAALEQAKRAGAKAFASAKDIALKGYGAMKAARAQSAGDSANG